MTLIRQPGPVDASMLDTSTMSRQSGLGAVKAVKESKRLNSSTDSRSPIGNQGAEVTRNTCSYAMEPAREGKSSEGALGEGLEHWT